ncbi:MAG: flagellar motor protein MotB [Puniceicoccaceae bacterium]|nr:MAG: flagellar motor protein MotB [Puniceicoccaceae bacterium]
MKYATRFLPLLALALAVVFSGCQRRPERPNPAQTMMGPGSGAGLAGQYVDTEGLFGDLDSELRPRDGDMGPDNQIRGLLPSVFFDFDSSAIRSAERPKLEEVASYLRNNPNTRLLLEGHCDWRGTTEYNLGLGDRRANSVRSYLVTLGVNTGRLETLSKGDLEAVVGGTEEQMARDRRVEVIVLR